MSIAAIAAIPAVRLTWPFDAFVDFIVNSPESQGLRAPKLRRSKLVLSTSWLSNAVRLCVPAEIT
ncbi:MAG: hypothetical protein IIZ13_14400 [Renibacterium sp.]|nr:hypothetical protein [Renibacterium sp.]